MTDFNFSVKITANNNEEAKKILTALFDIKKQLSTDDLCLFAEAIKKNPSLIKKAKMFL